MEEKSRSVSLNGLFYGLITGGAMIVLSLILFLLDLYMNKAVSWISYLVAIGGMVWGTLDYRKKYCNGFLTYGQAFKSVFMIGLFAGILSSIYLYFFIQFIHPGFINELLDQARANILLSNPNMTDEQIEQAVSMSSKFMSPVMMVVWGLVTYAVMSAIAGLIIAIFLKKEDPSLKSTI
ncbi:MAG: DUF4199 domain-containing protein [Bacteroidota bacterium]